MKTTTRTTERVARCCYCGLETTSTQAQTGQVERDGQTVHVQFSARPWADTDEAYDGCRGWE